MCLLDNSFRNAKIQFPEGSVAASVPVKYAKFTKDELNDIVPENGQNIAVKNSSSDKNIIINTNIYLDERKTLQ